MDRAAAQVQRGLEDARDPVGGARRNDGPAPSVAVLHGQQGLLRLQRSIGNHAVASLVGGSTVQREEDEEEEDDGSGAEDSVPRLDPQLRAQLQALFPIPQGPTYETMTTSTGAQSTSGELTRDALRLWRRETISLDDAYRRVSREPSLRDGSRRVVPTSGGQEPGEVTVTWGLLLALWDYHNVAGRDEGGSIPEVDPPNHRRASQLADVRAMLREGSPFRRAAESSYDHHEIAENPTAQGMVGAIMDTVDRLANGLAEGQQAQLTVNFQGHGGWGNLHGVDGRDLGRGQLRSIATYARERGVHLTYILDTCNAGASALLAENEEMVAIADQLPQDMDPQRRAQLAARGAPVSELMQIGHTLSDIATAMRSVRIRNTSERQTARRWLYDLRATLAHLMEFGFRSTDIEGVRDLALSVAEIDARFRRLETGRHLSQVQFRGSRESLAPTLHAINDILGREVDRLHTMAGEPASTR